jgi:hypothetical protein
MKEMDALRRNDYWVPESLPEIRSLSFGAPLAVPNRCCWLRAKQAAWLAGRLPAYGLI